jgi:hypothetical protein
MLKTLTEPVCIIDSAHGVYIPQIWAERYGSYWQSCNIRQEDVTILLHGPDHEFYWESWENVLNNYNHDGHTLWCGESGDLFELPPNFDPEND